MTAFLTAPSPDLTPNQVRELQDALNAIAADEGWRHKMIILPHGSRVERLRSWLCSYCQSQIAAGRETCRNCGAPAGA